eukprot:scaffold8845_cov55-Phaeocystis_antarctica.AAC.5
MATFSSISVGPRPLRIISVGLRLGFCRFFVDAHLRGEGQQLHTPPARRVNRRRTHAAAAVAVAALDEDTGGLVGLGLGSGLGRQGCQGATYLLTTHQPALPLLALEEVVVDILGDLTRDDLRDRAVLRGQRLSGQLLGAHHLQGALAHAAAHIDLAQRVQRQAHVGVAHVASRLELAVGGGEHAAQWAVAVELDLE